MQLMICEKSVCDFIVWSPFGMSVEHINFDQTFWKNTFSRLESFHRGYLVPEYFLMRIPRKLETLKLSDI